MCHGGDTPPPVGPPPARLQHRHGLGQQAQPILDLADMPRHLSEQDQTERSRQLLSHGYNVRQALPELR
jgi:hypothetical protein